MVGPPLPSKSGRGLGHHARSALAGTLAESRNRSPQVHAVAGGVVRLERLSRGLGIVSELHPDPALSVLGFDARSTPRPAEVGGSSEHPGPAAAVGLSAQGLDGDSLQAGSMGFSEPPAQAIDEESPSARARRSANRRLFA